MDIESEYQCNFKPFVQTRCKGLHQALMDMNHAPVDPNRFTLLTSDVILSRISMNYLLPTFDDWMICAGHVEELLSNYKPKHSCSHYGHRFNVRGCTTMTTVTYVMSKTQLKTNSIVLPIGGNICLYCKRVYEIRKIPGLNRITSSNYKFREDGISAEDSLEDSLVDDITDCQDSIAADNDDIAADTDNIANDYDNIATDYDNIAADNDNIAADTDYIAADNDDIAAVETKAMTEIDVDETVAKIEIDVKPDIKPLILGIAADKCEAMTEIDNIAADTDDIAADTDDIAADNDDIAADTDDAAADNDDIAVDNDNIAADTDDIAADNDGIASVETKASTEIDVDETVAKIEIDVKPEIKPLILDTENNLDEDSLSNDNITENNGGHNEPTEDPLESTTAKTAVPKILLVKNLTTQPQSINQQEPSIVNVSSSFPASSENGAKTLPVISATGAKIVRPPPGTVRFIKPVSLANIQTVQASSLKVRPIVLPKGLKPVPLSQIRAMQGIKPKTQVATNASAKDTSIAEDEPETNKPSDDLEKDDIFQQMKNSYENYKKSKDYVFHQNIETYNKSKNNIFQRMKNSFENELTQQMKNSIENGENSKQCSPEKKTEEEYKNYCKLCHIGFLKESSYLHHMQTTQEKHKELEQTTSEEKYCEECDESFAGDKAYRQHIHTEHSSGTETFTCTLCNVELKNEAALKSHNSKLHLDRRTKIYYCRGCERMKMFHCKKKHQDHIKEHYDPLDEKCNLQCPTCGKLFSQETGQYMKHLKTHDDDILDPCECKECLKERNENNKRPAGDNDDTEDLPKKEF